MRRFTRPLYYALVMILITLQSAFAVTGQVMFKDSRLGEIPVAVFDWSPGNGLAVGGVPLAVFPSTSKFTYLLQAKLGNLQDANNLSIIGSGLHSDYEITLVLGVSQTGSVNSITTPPFITNFSSNNNNSSINFFKIYLDTSKNSNQLAGTGFDDGTLIMSGVITESFGNFVVNNTIADKLDKYLTDNYQGVTTMRGTGGFNATARIDYFDPNYITLQSNALRLAVNTDTSEVTPFSKVDPSASFFNGTGSITPLRGNGNVNGMPSALGPADFQFQADAISSFDYPCTGTIGDFVWSDLDRDGIQDAGELGIPNAKLSLKDLQGNVIQTVTTGTNGDYLFTGICAGNYKVFVDETTLPGGVSPSPVNMGNDGAIDSNSNPAAVTLATDDATDKTVDFGYITPCTGKIGDLVWYDKNRNGIQDDGLAGIQGATVVLKDAAMQTITSTTTDANGIYGFSNLCAGTYNLEVTAPAGYGYQPTSSLSGSDRGTDSNGSPTTIVLTTDSTTDLSADFGFITPCTGMIGDFVWHDINRNGIQDAGEPGIDGVIVSLNDSGGTPLATTTSGPNGFYKFIDLCAGTYTVTVNATTLPLGYAPTTNSAPGSTPANDSNGSPTTVTLLDDVTTDKTIDFGYISPCTGAIGDFVWHDTNRDGIQNIGEAGIDGVKVNLLVNGSIIQTTSTNNGGAYLFTGLCPGDFTVTVDATTLPAGYTSTTTNAPGSDFTNDSNGIPASATLTEGEKNTSIDFGYVNPCSGVIGDFVWHDLDRDGIQGAAEPGIDGVTVKLAYPDGTIKPTTTGPNGYYQFTGLCAGNYGVTVDSGTLPPDFTPTTSNAPGSATDNDSNGSPAFVNLPDDFTSDQTIDFGYLSPCAGAIGDFVWNDLNKNGIQDAGEPGISGVTVLLENPANNTTLATTTTDASGLYIFRGLCSGTYKVEVNKSTLPAGFVATITNAPGSNVANDSNGSPTTVSLSIDTTDSTIDFGYYMVTGQGCSLTWGYWKTHSEFGPAPYDKTWAQLPKGASTPFFISGQTWYQVLQTEPRGNAYYILAHQYAAAYLNKLNGADISAISTQLTLAENLLKTYKPTDKLTTAVRNNFIGNAYLLDQYNNGNIGPGHCQDNTGTCTNGSGRKSNDHKSN